MIIAKKCAIIMPFFVVLEVMFIEFSECKKDTEEKNNKKIISISNFVHVKSIDDNKIRLINNKLLNVIKVEPINFNLKSQAEQNMILESYRTFLKQCNFDFQIYIQTQKANADKHIFDIRKCVEYEPQISEMAEDYINLIKEISNRRESIVRRFFIIFEEKEDSRISLIIEGLKACGNIATICTTEEIEKLFKSCFKSECQV